MFSGVSAGKFHFPVVEKGPKLEFIIQWPSTLQNLMLLHKTWLMSEEKDSLKTNHPKFT